MTELQLKKAIAEAIEAHVAWRARLEKAVDSPGAPRANAPKAAPERPCVFGRWLETLPPGQAGPRRKIEAVRILHDHFHMTAATVADALRRGETERARAMLKGGGPYWVASYFLIQALHDWRRTL